MPRLGSWQDRVYPGLLVAAALAAYLGFACPYVLGGDCAEFLSLAARGGVAHPPGYPLFTLILRALTGLAATSVPLGAARVTGVIAAAAAGVLYAACRSFLASPEASLVATALYASSPLAWLYATQAEAFALNALLVAGLIALSGPACPLRGVWRLGALSLVAGLGLAHHHTILTLAPVGLLGGLRALSECERSDHWKAGPLALGGFALGLTPLVAMVWFSRHPQERWVWGPPLDLHGLLRHLERAEYWEQQAHDRRTPVPSMHYAALADSVVRGLLWLGAPLALLGLGRALLGGGPGMRPRRARVGETRGAAALIASAVLAGPVLLGLLVGKPIGVYALIIERFHLLPQMLCAVPVGWGVDALLTRATPAARLAAAAMAVAAIVAVNGADVPGRIREAERPTVEQYLRNTLAELPPDAVLVGTGDHRCFGFFFLQTVLGVRRDVTYVEAGLLRDEWYRGRVAEALGLPAVGEEPGPLVALLVQKGRAVFVADSVDQLVPSGYATYAIGTVERVLSPGEAPPDPDALEAENLALARSFSREFGPPKNPWSWSGEVDATYARPFTELAGVFDARGEKERARENLERSAEHGRIHEVHSN